MKKVARNRKIVGILCLATLILVAGFGAWYFSTGKTSKNEITEPETKHGIYADVSNRDIKTFTECKEAGGAMYSKSYPDLCYYDEVVYYLIPRKGLEDLNPPENLRTYKDCLRQQGTSDIKTQSCKSWNGKVYQYTGDPVETFEDCEREVGFVLESNPPHCYGPDGTHHVGPSV